MTMPLFRAATKVVPPSFKAAKRLASDLASDTRKAWEMPLEEFKQNFGNLTKFVEAFEPSPEVRLLDAGHRRIDPVGWEQYRRDDPDSQWSDNQVAIFGRWAELGGDKFRKGWDATEDQIGIAGAHHREQVVGAMSAGESVPDAVLRGHPDIQDRLDEVSEQAFRPLGDDPRPGTARVGKFGERSVAREYIEAHYGEGSPNFAKNKDLRILDYGSGPRAIHTQALKEQGFRDVTAHDLPKSSRDAVRATWRQEGRKTKKKITDWPAATALIGERYDLVMAGKVLNVQENKEQLFDTLIELARAVSGEGGGKVIAGFPGAPRKLRNTPTGKAAQELEMEKHLRRFFNTVEKEHPPVGPTGKAAADPIYILSDPSTAAGIGIAPERTGVYEEGAFSPILPRAGSRKPGTIKKNPWSAARAGEKQYSPRVRAYREDDDAMGELLQYAKDGWAQGGRDWYNTQPLLDWHIAKLGKEEGERQWRQLMAVVAATSPGAPVRANIREASFYRAMINAAEAGTPIENQKGVPDAAGHPALEELIKRIERYGESKGAAPKRGLGEKNLKPPAGYGANYAPAHVKNIVAYIRGEWDDERALRNPKVLSFMQSLMGHRTAVAIDMHAMRILGMTSRDPAAWISKASIEINANHWEALKKVKAGHNLDLEVKGVKGKPGATEGRYTRTTSKVYDRKTEVTRFIKIRNLMEDGVIDASELEGLPGGRKAFDDSPGDAALGDYEGLNDIYVEIARRLSLELKEDVLPHQAQASIWLAAGERTGVDTDSLETFMGVVNTLVGTLAEEQGKTKLQVLHGLLNAGLAAWLVTFITKAAARKLRFEGPGVARYQLPGPDTEAEEKGAMPAPATSI